MTVPFLPIRKNRGATKSPTKLARKAIADFVESNIPRFEGWLDQIAEGIPQYDGQGEPVRDAKGSLVWLAKPDPALAMKLVVDVAEYHLPKLSRADVNVLGQIEHSASVGYSDQIKLMSTEQIKALLADHMFEEGVQLPVTDVEAKVVEPVPAWLDDGKT